MARTVDPITLEVLQGKLLTNVAQMSFRLIRAAHSFMIKEMEDCSASLFDAECRLLAESANIPIHLNCVGIVLKQILEHHIPAEAWQPGDVVLTNDPYLGGGSLGSAHTNDLVMYAPCFDRGRLVGFVGLMAHHLDIGAMWMGSRGWNVEIQQEGILIPPVRIAADGRLDEPMLELIVRNTRVPETLRNDLIAQFASIQAGARELEAIYAEYGAPTMAAAVEQIIRHAEARTREEIARIPDGTYRGEVPILDDGYAGGPHWLRVEIRKQGSDITFDFTGTDPQIRGPVNAPLSTTMSTIYYIVRCLTDPSIPNSEGCRRPIRIVAPEGTLVNARSPAAVNQRMVTCHSVVDLVMGALAEAIPERIIADSAGCQYNYVASYDPGRDVWESFGEVTPGGIGATATLDGMDVMACHITNCAMPAVEATEAECSVLYLRREFRQDAAGPGFRRGGSGQVEVYKVLAPEAELHRTSQKARIRPRGMAGGLPGANSRWIINEGTPKERICEFSIGDVERLEQGDTVSFYTTSGGGYGDPRRRERERVAADLRDGFISAKVAREIYGYEAAVEEEGEKVP